jgi:hypothetical protein
MSTRPYRRAVALIALAALGLAYLRFAGGATL